MYRSQPGEQPEVTLYVGRKREAQVVIWAVVGPTNS